MKPKIRQKTIMFVFAAGKITTAAKSSAISRMPKEPWKSFRRKALPLPAEATAANPFGLIGQMRKMRLFTALLMLQTTNTPKWAHRRKAISHSQILIPLGNMMLWLWDLTKTVTPAPLAILTDFARHARRLKALRQPLRATIQFRQLGITRFATDIISSGAPTPNLNPIFTANG